MILKFKILSAKISQIWIFSASFHMTLASPRWAIATTCRTWERPDVTRSTISTETNFCHLAADRPLSVEFATWSRSLRFCGWLNYIRVSIYAINSLILFFLQNGKRRKSVVTLCRNQQSFASEFFLRLTIVRYSARVCWQSLFSDYELVVFGYVSSILEVLPASRVRLLLSFLSRITE